MKGLIRMCDCEEIQGRWEPKMGDRVWVKRYERMATIIEIEGNEIIHVHIDGGEVIWRNTRNELIYIPSIEDLLEWLGDRFESLRRIRQTTRQVGHSEGCIFHKSTGSNDDVKALIRAYMHLEHGKSWSGEAWV